MDPAIIVRAFIGMVVHHSLNNNLWDPNRRLLKISNEDAARNFADILLNGISSGEDSKLEKKNGLKVSGLSGKNSSRKK
jgi:hypothetical protein